MKITISSPDGLGDFVLRIPFFRALLQDGHQLQIFLRRPAWDLAKIALPGVECLEIGADPYFSKTRTQKNPFKAEHRRILDFAPDLYVAALFGISFFDEVWLEQRKPIPAVGFSTNDAFWPSGTTVDPRELAARFHRSVSVPVNTPEVEKNRLLAALVLNREVPFEAPRLSALSSDDATARQLLGEHGLVPGKYWVSCMGTRSGIQMKDWGEEKWGSFLDAVPLEHPMVFLGNTKEALSIERIRSGRSFRGVNLANNPPPIGVSVALVALSSGYLGRDSGVMHLASAAGRPALAVFGGGHWGRFLPSRQAVAVSCAVPCRGCDFACPHERPYCIRDVSLDTMKIAWEKFRALDGGVEILEEACSALIQKKISSVDPDHAQHTKEALRKAEALKRRSFLHRLLGS